MIHDSTRKLNWFIALAQQGQSAAGNEAARRQLRQMERFYRLMLVHLRRAIDAWEAEKGER